MSGLSKWKVVVYLTAIFLAGSVSGWVVANRTAKQKATTAPGSDEIAKWTRQRVERVICKLNVDDEQKKRIDAIIDRSSAELNALHKEHIGRIRQASSNRTAQVMAVLTPEQQRQYEQFIEKERQELKARQESARGTNAWRGKGRGHDRDEGSREKRGTTNSAGKRPTDGSTNLNTEQKR